MKVPPVFWLLILLGARMPALGQTVPPGAPVPPGYGPPPPTIYVPPVNSARLPAPRVAPAALRREARELLDLSQSLQPDIDSLSRGLFPKDVTDKLKRIEKLSKRLRGEVAPFAH